MSALATCHLNNTHRFQIFALFWKRFLSEHFHHQNHSFSARSGLPWNCGSSKKIAFHFIIVLLVLSLLCYLVNFEILRNIPPKFLKCCLMVSFIPWYLLSTHYILGPILSPCSTSVNRTHKDPFPFTVCILECERWTVNI